MLSLKAKPIYTGNPSRLLNPYCQKYFLLLSECDKTKEMENDPDRCASPVSTPPRMEHVVWISQQGCSFPSQTASTGASVLSSPSPSVEVGSQPESLKSLSPSSGTLMLALHSNPRTLTSQRRAMARKIVPFSKNGLSSSPGFIIMKKMIQYYVLFVQNRTPKKHLISATKKEEAFLKRGFSNWKKVLDKFKEHEAFQCHKTSVDYEVNIPKSCHNIYELASEQPKTKLKSNRRCLMKIIECLQYLCRQGQAIQGGTDDESNFVQLLKLRAKDDSAWLEWIQKTDDKYTSHDIQNEIITIMAHQVHLVNDIRSNFFSIVADEYTDVNNQEQLTICLRWVDDTLEAHEDFLGFYLIPDIASDTVVSVIKDAFIRLQISLQNCRGQCYDGASNMLGKRSGVAKQIQDIQKKAYPTHCHAHSLSLSVQDATSHCKILPDTVNNTNEIVKLVKFS